MAFKVSQFMQNNVAKLFGRKPVNQTGWQQQSRPDETKQSGTGDLFGRYDDQVSMDAHLLFAWFEEIEKILIG